MKQHNDATIQNLIKIKDQTEYSQKYKEFMEDYALYKSTKNLVNGLKINAKSENYEKMMQDIKGYAQDWGGEGAIIAKAQPISQYEKYLNKMYEETGNVFNATATNMSTTSSMSNSVQKYKEIEPIGYEEIKPVEYKEIKVEDTTDKKLDDGKWIMPCKGKIVGHYGEVRPTHIHNGIDIAVPVGTPVKAVADGVVCAVGPAKGYGYWVVINHGKIGGTDVTSEYGHLSSWSVKHGQFVKKGDIIAKSGNTGRSYGPHVHITIREGTFQGRPVSPDKYIKY
ncbi:MAG: M23 family metallopeptidase [bacterium]|nr:M23 family metallopeptidase [bacterium]